MSARRALSVSALLALALAEACSDGGRPEVAKPNGDAGGAAGAAGSGGKPDASDDRDEPDAPSDADASDAALPPVRLGIAPVPASSGDAGPSPAEQKLAELEVLALGSRGVSQVWRWDALYESPKLPSASAWAKLSGLSQLHAQGNRSLLLCVALTDRTLDARPPGSAPGWNDPTTRAALDALVDKVFTTFGDELFALSFGNDLDRYLAKETPTNTAELGALVEHGIEYAKQHPARPKALLVGATFGSDALAKPPSAVVAGILAKADVAVATLYPLDPGFAARPPAAVAQDLDALIAMGQADAGVDAGPAKPILLQEVGYPSASANASSPSQQSSFYLGLFQALTTRRQHFPFVSVNGLHDAHLARCQSEAAAFGASGNATAIASRCSLGLRGADGGAKPALSSVLAALAAFSTP